MTHRIVVIGGGFVGTLCARLLAKASLPETEIVLLSQSDHFLFAPLLIEALAGEIGETDCCEPLKPWAKRRGVHFIQGRALCVQRAKKRIQYQDAVSQLEEVLSYDQLIFAQGASPTFFNIPGAKEYALPLKTYADVRMLHTRIDNLLEQAHKEPLSTSTSELLSFGVVGGGPTGVEAICSIRVYIKNHPRFSALLTHCSFFIIEGSQDVLNGFPEPLKAAAKRELTKQKIVFHTNEAVTGVTPTEVATVNRHLSYTILLWTAGVVPNTVPVDPAFDLTSPAPFPVLKDTIELDPHHFVAGDVVSTEWNGVRIPKNGQIAIQYAFYLANLLIARTRQTTEPSFTPELKGYFLGLGETGLLFTKGNVLQSRLISHLRLWIYRYRQWQILR
ncbi:FAD-dependent oxidoreductase [Patescibacteria group bacterium]|nr:FAD-dependent oxidoreductase [Patescibacteria group bacterium]